MHSYTLTLYNPEHLVMGLYEKEGKQYQDNTNFHCCPESHFPQSPSLVAPRRAGSKSQC